jgi:hypothetical protein
LSAGRKTESFLDLAKGVINCVEGEMPESGRIARTASMWRRGGNMYIKKVIFKFKSEILGI